MTTLTTFFPCLLRIAIINDSTRTSTTPRNSSNSSGSGRAELSSPSIPAPQPAHAHCRRNFGWCKPPSLIDDFCAGSDQEVCYLVRNALGCQEESSTSGHADFFVFGLTLRCRSGWTRETEKQMKMLRHEPGYSSKGRRPASGVLGNGPPPSSAWSSSSQLQLASAATYDFLLPARAVVPMPFLLRYFGFRPRLGILSNTRFGLQPAISWTTAAAVRGWSFDVNGFSWETSRFPQLRFWKCTLGLAVLSSSFMDSGVNVNAGTVLGPSFSFAHAASGGCWCWKLPYLLPPSTTTKPFKLHPPVKPDSRTPSAFFTDCQCKHLSRLSLFLQYNLAGVVIFINAHHFTLICLTASIIGNSTNPEPDLRHALLILQPVSPSVLIIGRYRHYGRFSHAFTVNVSLPSPMVMVLLHFLSSMMTQTSSFKSLQARACARGFSSSKPTPVGELFQWANSISFGTLTNFHPGPFSIPSHDHNPASRGGKASLCICRNVRTESSSALAKIVSSSFSEKFNFNVLINANAGVGYALSSAFNKSTRPVLAVVGLPPSSPSSPCT
ncbi:hypothetical protein CPB84DRAFT_1967647 [Gymnopilus junonius]|uniref:Uncharacterized protein n=1 Tax=Gymnopilus junonius TaxID=109634 RepID=A0A9P5N9U0_GYMJU|nr:hypothetical protein CPB84DRAFT_1967647 [Gymnopilus junonius]